MSAEGARRVPWEEGDCPPLLSMSGRAPFSLQPHSTCYSKTTWQVILENEHTYLPRSHSSIWKTSQIQMGALWEGTDRRGAAVALPALKSCGLFVTVWGVGGEGVHGHLSHPRPRVRKIERTESTPNSP